MKYLNSENLKQLNIETPQHSNSYKIDYLDTQTLKHLNT